MMELVDLTTVVMAVVDQIKAVRNPVLLTGVAVQVDRVRVPIVLES
jgi:hypothetical protein